MAGARVVEANHARGVAAREMQSHGGPADYILFVDGKALGKPRGEVEAREYLERMSGRAHEASNPLAATMPREVSAASR